MVEFCMLRELSLDESLIYGAYLERSILRLHN